MAPPAFLRWTGVALAAGGLLTIIINAVLTPLLPHGGDYAVSAASTAFLWRQGASAVAAALLLFGSVGVYLRQSEKSGRFAAIAFVIAFIGTALLLATEWTQVFDIRDLALRAPAALKEISDLGALIALGTFTIGWIALAAFTAWAAILPRKAGWLVIIGFFVIPLSPIAGNAILGAGWIWLGIRTRSRT